ncbi:DMT family transporter [Pseudoduganella violacea]|uniref:Drug/metabolite transporter (DMT)-like permease n=1 Tax=Pseudoduganella violacea TaxID=1715466 RepID=A0A7W5BBF1_9BURK|nr:DMT family transporter [Pseudoduganella violacea]MBB3119898.1 drug/metabolite transporter (DMT)-like permease [Pseudoduganella violacea]
MSQHARGILALLLVTVVWGTTFPAMKDMTGYLSANWIVVSRFTMAGLLLSPFLLRARWKDLHYGFLAGLVLFFCYLFQVEGLALTTSNRNAFICGLNVLVPPLLGRLLGRKAEGRIVLALALAMAGLFALCWDGNLAWARGDTLALLAALCFGVYILMMEAFSRKAERLMTLTAAQIWTVAICAGLWILLREVPRGQIDVHQDQLNYWAYVWQGLKLYSVNLIYLGVVATAAIISLQTWGQSHATANEAAVIYAFEPGCAAIFAYFWLGETLGWTGLLGAVLLISGMIVSQWNSAPRPTASLAPE